MNGFVLRAMVNNKPVPLRTRYQHSEQVINSEDAKELVPLSFKLINYLDKKKALETGRADDEDQQARVIEQSFRSTNLQDINNDDDLFKVSRGLFIEII